MGNEDYNYLNSEAALREAENDDDYLDVRQTVFEAKDHIKSLQHYLYYLRQYDANEGNLQNIENYLTLIANEFEVLLSNTRIEVAEKAALKKTATELSDKNDRQRYNKGLEHYDNGDYTIARAIFAALAKTSKDKEVKKCAVESVRIVSGWIAHLGGNE